VLDRRYDRCAFTDAILILVIWQVVRETQRLVVRRRDVITDETRRAIAILIAVTRRRALDLAPTDRQELSTDEKTRP
jgi:hypothetical protein